MLPVRSTQAKLKNKRPSISKKDVQDDLNYAHYKELTAGFQVAQEVVDKLASQINRNFWEKNKKRLVSKRAE